MKQIIYLMTVTTIIISSCKKDNIQTSPITSIAMVNAVAGGTTVKLGSNAITIANNNTNGTQLALIAGTNDLYVWPVGDSLHPYYTQNKFISADREVYSLFLCCAPAQPKE